MGYPAAIRVEARVAPGTDGFPSDMQEELDALRAIAGPMGEDPEALPPRLDGSRALAERLLEYELDGDVPVPAATVIEEIRREVEATAGALTARLGTS